MANEFENAEKVIVFGQWIRSIGVDWSEISVDIEQRDSVTHCWYDIIRIIVSKKPPRTAIGQVKAFAAYHGGRVIYTIQEAT